MCKNYAIFLIFLQFFLKIIAENCPKVFQPPSQCFDISEIADYAQVAVELENHFTNYLKLLTESNLIVDENEPGVDLFFSPQLSEEVRHLQFNGNSLLNFLQIAFHHLSRDHGLNGEQILYCLKQLNISGDALGICEKISEDFECSPMPSYQPLDGKCVRQGEKLKGAKNTAYGRLMKNSYFNSIHEFRLKSNGNPLPSPRLISNALRTLYTPHNFESSTNLQNDLLLFFIKVVIFDLAKTLKAQTFESNFGFECCESNGRSALSPRFCNHNCAPITIPANDGVFRGQKCMNYLRSMVTHEGCAMQEAKILNTVSHFLDMSFIYAHENVEIAIKNGGKFPKEFRSLILTADERILMLPQIYLIVSTFLQFHNLIAENLAKIHPNFDEETIFYETRRFTIAVYQNVIYNEVLPVLLSEKTLNDFKLNSNDACYSPNIDPSVTSEFVASVGRYFHNFIHDSYKIHFKNGTKKVFKLRKLFFHETEEIDKLKNIAEMTARPWNSANVSNEISNYLFSANGGLGLDLRALDIQAERDFGVATFCDALYYLNLTNGECVSSFQQFEEFMPSQDLEFLKYAFAHPCDVDLGVGGAFHSTDDSELLSDVFEKLFAIQFFRTKCGDPWFYTNVLSADQISLVNEFSFSDILCLIHPKLNIQEFAFLTPSINNSVEKCTADLDLSEWKLVQESKKTDNKDEES